MWRTNPIKLQNSALSRICHAKTDADYHKRGILTRLGHQSKRPAPTANPGDAARQRLLRGMAPFASLV